MFLSAQSVQYTFSGAHPPAIRVKNGDTVRLETQDCFSNRLLSGVWEPTPIELEDPVTGPVFVKGAHPGTMLRIEVTDIHFPEFGIVESVRGSGCLGPHIQQNTARIVPIQGNMACLSDTLRVPLQPMIGVLGVAPASGERMTMLPGEHGGNMDCTRITIGSTVFLPVFVEGALLAAGDLHAAMGDGEVGVSGLEVSGEVTLRVSVVDDWHMPFPVVCHQDRVYVVASAETMDEACALAAEQMYQLLITLGGLRPDDAVALTTIAADLHVCQIVNPLKTAAMSISQTYLNLPDTHPCANFNEKDI